MNARAERADFAESTDAGLTIDLLVEAAEDAGKHPVRHDRPLAVTAKRLH
jgi:hypothetical protein